MAKEWQYLQNDLQAARTFCNSHPALSLLLFLAIGIFMLIIFNFIFNERVYPTRFGGLPLGGLWVRIIAGGAFFYFILGMFFKKSILLKLFFVIPTITLVWFIYKDYD